MLITYGPLRQGSGVPSMSVSVLIIQQHFVIMLAAALDVRPSARPDDPKMWTHPRPAGQHRPLGTLGWSQRAGLFDRHLTLARNRRDPAGGRRASMMRAQRRGSAAHQLDASACSVRRWDSTARSSGTGRPRMPGDWGIDAVQVVTDDGPGGERRRIDDIRVMCSRGRRP